MTLYQAFLGKVSLVAAYGILSAHRIGDQSSAAIVTLKPSSASVTGIWHDRREYASRSDAAALSCRPTTRCLAVLPRAQRADDRAYSPDHRVPLKRPSSGHVRTGIGKRVTAGADCSAASRRCPTAAWAVAMVARSDAEMRIV
ncbi:hypothetical protein SPH9361_03010 [Sphingobium sp. CECT 9361]|nr:hypothetical protein SPH9361_03010 [Sphingobium sp. CECT 9361]